MSDNTAKTPWFAIWASVAVLAIVVGAGAFLLLSHNPLLFPAANQPTANPPSATSSAGSDAAGPLTGAVSVGEGSHTVDTYIDFMCPVCGAFESQYGAQLLTLASDGKITLVYHPVSILDRASQGTQYSTRAANAFLCVAEASPDRVTAYATALFAKQPPESSPGLDDATLVQLAKDVGAADIATCQSTLAHAGLVRSNTAALPEDPVSHGAGTPTVIIDGSYTTLGEIAQSPTYFTDELGK